MKKFLLILPFCCWLTAVPALNVDSLWGLWNDKTQPDTIRLKAMHKIVGGIIHSYPDSAYYLAGMEYDYAESAGNKKWISKALNTQGRSCYIKGNYEKALSYYQKSLQITEEIGDKNGMADSYNFIGIICEIQGNYEEALSYYGRSLKIREETGNNSGIGISLNNMGMVYRQRGQYQNALSHYARSLKISEEIGDKIMIGNTLNNMGAIYQELGELEQARELFSRSLKINQEIDDKLGIGLSLNYLGIYHSSQGDYEKGLDYFTESLKMREEVQHMQGMAATLNNMGLVYKELKDYQNALEHFKRSLKIKEELDNKMGMAISLNGIGVMYFIQGNYSEALTYSSKSLDLAKKIGGIRPLKDAADNLHKVFKATGQYQKALEMQEIYITMRDSIVNEENTKALLQQQYKYEYEKIAAADSIRNTELAKVKDAQLFAQQAKLNQGKTIRYGLLGGLLVIALSSLLIIRSYKQKLLAREQLGIKNKEINKLKGQELERIRIAKELHDGLGGSLAGIKMRLSSLAKDKNSDVADLNELSVQVGEACREVRNISHNLMPPVITDRHITEAIGEFVNEFGRSSGLKINFDCFPEGNLNKLDNLVQIDLYRIVQELLNNVYKHAGANKVEIGLMMDEEGINLMVEDDGSGFDPKKSTKGIGLSNIHSRVEALGGIVKVDSQKKRGTAIHINIVLKQTA